MLPNPWLVKSAATAREARRFLWRLTLLAVTLGLLNAPELRAQSAPATAAPLPSFEVVSIKSNRSGGLQVRFALPSGRFTATNVTAKMLIEYAYNERSAGISLRDNQIAAGPNWLSSERYDVDAKIEDSLVKAKEQTLPSDQWEDQVRLMLQSLLAERFKLQVSYTTRELPAYALMVAKGGPKLTPSTVAATGPSGSLPSGADLISGSNSPKGPSMRLGRTSLAGVGLPMATLAAMLSRAPELAGREVIDKTGLAGRFDFSLKWALDQTLAPVPAAQAGGRPPSEAPPDVSGPSIFTALQEQLGLKLEPTKAPVDLIVVDHIEKPPEG